MGYPCLGIVMVSFLHENMKLSSLSSVRYLYDQWFSAIPEIYINSIYNLINILQPNIEEFNYPIPKNCAAGNTGVFVNGRELNEKDLDLLSSRGLPITENRSYLIDITGKVVDEQTREELDGLGKLAPT